MADIATGVGSQQPKRHSDIADRLSPSRHPSKLHRPEGSCTQISCRTLKKQEQDNDDQH
jgi:hypothetical protein